MNVKQLQKQVGQLLRMRPLPVRMGSDGTRLQETDDQWELQQLLDNPPRARLSNVRTDHVIELQPDNIREYRSPDFLLLRCQLIVTASGISVEPIHTVDSRFTRLEQLMPAFLDEMRRHLVTTPLRREIVLLKRSWSYWAKGNELVYYFDDYPDLLSLMQILANYGLVTDITHNNVARYQMDEELAQYLGA